MSRPDGTGVSGRIVAGAVLIVLGGLFLLDNMGFVDARDVFRYWPLILIGVGLAKVLQARFAAQRVGGFIMMAVGGLFLLRAFHLYWFHMRDLWPAFLLVIGAGLVWQALARRRELPTGAAPGPSAAAIPADADSAERVLAGARDRLESSRPSRGEPGRDVGSVLNEFAFMGGGDRVVRSQDFRGGEITAIMGGFRIDLRGAAMAGDSATIHVFALWGGVDFEVPEEWNVSLQGVPILGGFTNTTRAFRQADGAAKTLIVKGVAIMGGVEVKN